MKNKALALKALAKDCEIRGQYIVEGQTCAIGCLALLAGVSKRYLVRNNWAPVCDLPRVQVAIEDKFGLEPGHLSTIQRINDGSTFIKNRRKQVLKFIRGFK